MPRVTQLVRAEQANLAPEPSFLTAEPGRLLLSISVVTKSNSTETWGGNRSVVHTRAPREACGRRVPQKEGDGPGSHRCTGIHGNTSQFQTHFLISYTQTILQGSAPSLSEESPLVHQGCDSLSLSPTPTHCASVWF